jgi:hypothetical protein
MGEKNKGREREVKVRKAEKKKKKKKKGFFFLCAYGELGRVAGRPFLDDGGDGTNAVQLRRSAVKGLGFIPFALALVLRNRAVGPDNYINEVEIEIEI